MKSRNVKKKVRYYTVNHDSVMRFKNVNITFFNTTHSIPDSLEFAFILHTVQSFIQVNLNLIKVYMDTTRQISNVWLK